jgi:hypothetical protein
VSNQLTARQPSAAIFGARMVATRAFLVTEPARATGGDPLPAFVRSLAEVTRKPNKNADAVALRYEAIIAELRAQLADAREQREAWWQVADRTQRLVEAWQAPTRRP